MHLKVSQTPLQSKDYPSNPPLNFICVIRIRVNQFKMEPCEGRHDRKSASLIDVSKRHPHTTLAVTA